MLRHHRRLQTGGAESCFKKYICPDKFWWHSGMAVTEHKILAYYNRCSSAERISNINSDKLVVLDAGSVSQFGTVEECSKAGIYRSLLKDA